MARAAKKGAYYQVVKSRLWGGGSFSRLSPLACSGQALFLFLLTCPDRHETGIWRMGAGRVMDYTGWGPSELASVRSELESEGMLSWDDRAQVICLTNATAHLQCQSPNVAMAWGRHLASLPSCDLVPQRTQELKAFLKDLGEAFLKAFMQGLGKGNGDDLVHPQAPSPKSKAPSPKPQVISPPSPPPEASEREPWEEEPNGDEMTREDPEGKAKDEEPIPIPTGFKSMHGLAGSAKVKLSQVELRELCAFLSDRFPEIAPLGVKRLLQAGLTLHGARKVDALRGRMDKDTTRKPTNPGAYYFTALLEEAESSARAEAAHG